MNAVKSAFQKVTSGGGPTPPKGAGTAVAASVALLATAFGLSQSLVAVKPGHLGIVYNRVGGIDWRATFENGLSARVLVLRHVGTCMTIWNHI